MAYTYYYGGVVSNTSSGSTRKWSSELGVQVNSASEKNASISLVGGWYQSSHGTSTTTAFSANAMHVYLRENGSNLSTWVNSSQITSYGKTHYDKTSSTRTLARTKSEYTVTYTCLAQVTSPSVWKGSSTATYTYTVPARNSHLIQYNANGGTGTIADTRKYYSDTDEIAYYETLSDGTGFSKNGARLVGWNTSADGSGTAYSLSETYTANGTATVILYAQWKSEMLVKANGVWQGVESEHVKINGTWVCIDGKKTKVNGSWIDS